MLTVSYCAKQIQRHPIRFVLFLMRRVAVPVRAPRHALHTHRIAVAATRTARFSSLTRRTTAIFQIFILLFRPSPP
jgi:hypothetical protein